jgi:seryl-tRNA synthetase
MIIHVDFQFLPKGDEIEEAAARVSGRFIGIMQNRTVKVNAALEILDVDFVSFRAYFEIPTPTEQKEKSID